MKTRKSFVTDEEGEGYIASNSDNNVDRKSVKKRIEKSATSKIILNEENAEDLWEDLEVKESGSMSDPETPINPQALEQKS